METIQDDIQVAAERGFCFDFEGTRHSTGDPRVTPHEIRKIVGGIPDNIPIVQILEDGTQATLQEDQEVPLVRCIRFRRLPRFIRGRDRVESDLALVLKEYPNAVLGPHHEYFLIPDFPLPPGLFRQEKTTLLVVLPPTYPAAAPTNFHVTWGLALASGLTINNYTGPATLYGQTWGIFSFRIDAEAWLPSNGLAAADNLLTFLTAVRARLQEGA